MSGATGNRALVLTKKFGPLVLQDFPLPIPLGDRHVRVRVRAAGVNPVDYKILRYGLFFPEQAYPLVIGAEGAGEVVEIGSGVTTLRVGDRVFFNANVADKSTAAYQQYATVEEEYAFTISENVTIDEAASLPVGFTTAGMTLYAYQGLPKFWEGAKAVENQFYLVWGGASVVGQAAIQFAKKAGFSVIATASEHNHAYLRDKLGADYVFDYKSADVFAAIRAVVGDSLRHALDAGGATSDQLAGIGTVVALENATLVSVTNRQIAEIVPATPGRVVMFVQANIYGNREFAIPFWGAVRDGFTKGEFIPPAVKVVKGGLAGLEAALDELQSGKVSGFKYVVHV
ncbi:hypothetical protein HK405_011877 [Cladochytrium tenue]|nr:hypothetical protein HK405_011877 [Cladochytrium tenue]